MSEERKPLFHGELQLMVWGDSSTTGPWVKFWCHPDDLEQFKLFRLRKGKEAGTRLATAMFEIGDDEAIVSQPTGAPAQAPQPAQASAPGAPRRYHPPHIGALAMLAVRYCRDPEFIEWMTDGPALLDAEEQSAGVYDACRAEPRKMDNIAKAFILHLCGIEAKHGAGASRKHLDTDHEAAALFHERIRHPYLDYRKEKGLT